MNYEEATAKRTALHAATDRASAACAALGGSSGANGLTPDAVKFSPPYRAAKARLDVALKAEREINLYVAKHFRAEERAALTARRESQAAASRS